MAEFSYLQLSNSKRWALIYLASGYDRNEICEMVPNDKTKDTGVDLTTLERWLWSDHTFRHAWEQVNLDPAWCQRNISAPLMLSMLMQKDLEYLSGKQYKGFSPKKLELLMTQLGMINQVDQTGAVKLQELIAKARTSLPRITVVDGATVQPKELT